MEQHCIDTSWYGIFLEQLIVTQLLTSPEV
jgi:hypothetical protein